MLEDENAMQLNSSSHNHLHFQMPILQASSTLDSIAEGKMMIMQ